MKFKLELSLPEVNILDDVISKVDIDDLPSSDQVHIRSVNSKVEIILNNIKNRDQLTIQVKMAVAKFTDKNWQEIDKNDELYFDLGINDQRRRLLCLELKEILEGMGSSERISLQECNSLVTVGDCVDLIVSKL